MKDQSKIVDDAERKLQEEKKFKLRKAMADSTLIDELPQVWLSRTRKKASYISCDITKIKIFPPNPSLGTSQKSHPRGRNGHETGGTRPRAQRPSARGRSPPLPLAA
jgi:hypothetical protein